MEDIRSLVENHIRNTIRKHLIESLKMPRRVSVLGGFLQGTKIGLGRGINPESIAKVIVPGIGATLKKDKHGSSVGASSAFSNVIKSGLAGLAVSAIGGGLEGAFRAKKANRFLSRRRKTRVKDAEEYKAAVEANKRKINLAKRMARHEIFDANADARLKREAEATTPRLEGGVLNPSNGTTPYGIAPDPTRNPVTGSLVSRPPSLS